VREEKVKEKKLAKWLEDLAAFSSIPWHGGKPAEEKIEERY